MRNFERGPENIRGQNIDRVFSKAEGYLDIDNIKMESFLDAEGFNRENVERDIARVEELKNRWAERSSQQGKERGARYAKVFEALIHAGELNNWFGPDAHTIRPSEYDDFINGVDEIIEFRPSEEEPSQLALAIDVTYSSGISDKLERIKEEIESGKLTEVRYFLSEESGIAPKSLLNVPRVIVWSSIEMVDELAGLWSDKKGDALAEHEAQLLVLYEILLQLNKFAEYAREIGKEDIAKYYEKAAGIVQNIVEQKDKVALREKLGWEPDKDPVFSAMKRQLDSTFAIKKAEAA